MELTKTDASTNPTEHGCYVVWLLGSKYPQVLFWNGSGLWRRGSMRVHATHWMGPLPE
jgi:hypothetical protein